MDKDKTKPGEQAQSATSTLRKSKRRQRKKKPSNVKIEENKSPEQQKPAVIEVQETPKSPPPAPPITVDVARDLREATAKVLNEVKNVIAEAIPAMEKKKGDEKDRDQVKAEREAKRLAKKNKKQGGAAETQDGPVPVAGGAEKAPKVPQMKKDKKETPPPTSTPSAPPATLTKSNTDTEISAKLENLHLTEKPEKPQLSKAERRAIQEAQRAAKAQAQAEKAAAKDKKSPGNPPGKPQKGTPKPTEGPQTATTTTNSKKKVEIKKPTTHRVKLFSHLYVEKLSPEDTAGEEPVHPAIIQLGVQHSQGTIIGANARCIAFLNALKLVIAEFVTPPQKIFSRSLEAAVQSSIAYLQKCRPISVSMANALKAIKGQINHLPDNETEEQHKETLCDFIETYIRDQIEKAAVAISSKVQEKILKGDVILTFGCSSLIKHILEEAHRRHVDFRVIVVDSRPLNEGQEMLRRLTAEGIRCSCVQINAVSFVMPEVTKVLLGAHALLANGYVMSRTGTAQVALVAKSYNVPTLVCCETHKFSERVQTDAFVYNEIGDPNDLVKVNGVQEGLKGWETTSHLTPLHLYYDITPPELVAAVVTEVAILPCTSVPVILRIKPTEVWY